MRKALGGPSSPAAALQIPHDAVSRQLLAAHPSSLKLVGDRGWDKNEQRPGFELRTTGQCASHIASIADCEKAAKQLGLSDTTAVANWFGSFRPSGCFIRRGRLTLNVDHTGTGSCSSTSKCLCVVLTASPTLFPTFAPTSMAQFNSLSPTLIPTLLPTPAPTQTPTAVPRFELRMSGDCAVRIKTVAECKEAAKELGLPKTSARDDRRKKSRVILVAAMVGL